MSKTKFRYNPKTLSYEKVRRSVGERVLRGIIFIAPTITLSIILGFVFAYRIESPKEKALQNEVETLKAEFAIVQERMQLVDQVTESIKQRDEDLYRTALGASSFPDELRLMGVGGSDAYKSYKNKSNSELLIATFSKLDQLERKLNAQSLSFKELAKLAKEREKRLASLPAIQPVNNKELKRMASGYGWRIDPVYGTRKMHWGTDFTAKVGTDIYATGDGVVEITRVNSWGYGREIVINHGFGYKTRYAHLSSFLVEVGDTVKRGDLIGLVGNTGKSTGAHLHYEVEKDGHKVNPINYFHSDLTPEQYEKIVEISNNALKSMD
ncbi:peptidase M23 [Brumimicrobium salinarum]|uniref:Peptidase M23 n=1 Tax=Brumimicrobium salinarum TaxID=2058658 RepID=A0A2I0R039_9FLAO|nr:M23 family metallopeptidase [Brumimicrobium salinarum]PKR79750.1 peptidase M23 [Brumimicrobium salinarum]